MSIFVGKKPVENCMKIEEREREAKEGQEVKGGSRKWHIQGVCIWQTRYQILDIRVPLPAWWRGKPRG